MKAAILYLERLEFLLRGPALLAILVIALAFAYAGWSGDRWRDAQAASLSAFDGKTREEMREWRGQLVEVEAGSTEASPFDANPMSITFAATLPPASLGDFAVGHADLHPASADISPWRNVSSVFGRYQFDNPTTLSTSSFDVAMAVIVLMPILMIAVSFNALARERKSGSLAMVLASPVRLTELTWTRLAFRNGLLWFAALIAMLALFFANDAGGDRSARFLMWLAVALLYGLFWFAAIAYCVARFRTATATVGALVGLWLLFTLALPATVATASEALYPTPSRLAMLSQVRIAQGETNRELAKVTEGFLMDHPDLSVGDESMPSYLRAAFLSNQAARETTRPIVDGFEAAWAGRESTLRWAQYLSPSIIAQRLLLLSAGADLDRQHRFQSQVQASLDELASSIGPAIVSRNRVSLEQYDQLEEFVFSDASPGQLMSKAMVPAIFLLLVSMLLIVAAHRRLAQEQFQGV
jgi:ABC-2 type transport system permease protein